MNSQQGESSPAPLDGGTSDASPPPLDGGTSDASPAPLDGGTPDASPAPLDGGTSDPSSAPLDDGTLDASPASESGGAPPVLEDDGVVSAAPEGAASSGSSSPPPDDSLAGTPSEGQDDGSLETPANRSPNGGFSSGTIATFLGTVFGGLALILAVPPAWPSFKALFTDGTDGSGLSTELGEVNDAREPPRFSAEGMVRPNSSLPSYSVNLRNNSGATATVEYVTATIVDYTRLQYCGVLGGGDSGELKVAAYARLVLPVQPKPRARVQARLGERGIQVAADDTVPISVYFEIEGIDRGLPGIYALDLAVRDAASGHEQKIGNVIVAEKIETPGYYLPIDAQRMREVEAVSRESDWCYANNISAVPRVLSSAQPAKIGPDLAAQLSGISKLAWPPGVSPAIARQAARRLLAARAYSSPDPGAVVLAPAAARASGDPAFERKVREDAVALLLKVASEPDGAFAPTAAEDVLDLEPSNTAAREIVERSTRTQPPSG